MSIRREERLQGVHPSLVSVVKRASEELFKNTEMQLLIIEGVRTQERQQQLFNQGRTTPGRIVTNSLKSKHLKQLDGFGHAVDIALCDSKGNVDWNDLTKFELIRRAMVKAAKELKVPNLRSGADWDKNDIPDMKEVDAYMKRFRRRPLVDYPHYELV